MSQRKYKKNIKGWYGKIYGLLRYLKTVNNLSKLFAFVVYNKVFSFRLYRIWIHHHKGTKCITCLITMLCPPWLCTFPSSVLPPLCKGPPLVAEPGPQRPTHGVGGRRWRGWLEACPRLNPCKGWPGDVTLLVAPLLLCDRMTALSLVSGVSMCVRWVRQWRGAQGLLLPAAMGQARQEIDHKARQEIYHKCSPDRCFQ